MMFFRYTKYKKKATDNKYNTISNHNFSIYNLNILICIFILIVSIGYASTNMELNISGETAFRIEADIRIMECRFAGSTNGGMEEYNSQYTKNTIITGIKLPTLDSKVMYEITVTNFVNINIILSSIEELNYNNSKIEYFLDGFDINDKINGLSTTIIKIGFRYKKEVTILPDNQTLEARLEFIFKKSDTNPPVIAVVSDQPKNVFISQADNITLSEYVTAFDDVDSDVTNKITYSSSPEFNKDKPGKYVITYNVMDEAGNKAVPLKVTILIWNFIKIVNGQYHGIALGSDGSVWTWGYNIYGQRGLGNTTSAASYRAPTKIPQSYFDNEQVVDIAAGYLSSYAITSNGKGYAWGDGTSYQLGNNSTSNQTRPVSISLPNDIKFTQISSFYQTGAAVGDDGNIYTWGLSIYGSNGNGGNGDKRTPSAITSSNNFVDVSQGYYGGAAVNNNGEVFVWGTNLEGELGAGNTSGYNHPPTKVPSLNNIENVSYGATHILALTNNGQVYAWGSNGSGRLGLGDTSTKSTPTLIPNLVNVSQINAGYDFSQFKVGNNIYSSGFSNFGELFTGNTTTIQTPNLSTMINVAGNVSYTAGRFDNAYILSIDGSLVYGIGYCDAIGQEFGSTSVQATSSNAVIPWTFTPTE